jgi:hypothetical protein
MRLTRPQCPDTPRQWERLAGWASGRAKRIAVAAMAAVVLVVSAVLVASAASSPRTMKFACATELYGTKDVLTYVSRASSCDGADEKLVEFAKDFPVYVCHKEHGTPRSARNTRAKQGIRSHGPAGLIRLVDNPSRCSPKSEGVARQGRGRRNRDHGVGPPTRPANRSGHQTE